MGISPKFTNEQIMNEFSYQIHSRLNQMGFGFLGIYAIQLNETLFYIKLVDSSYNLACGEYIYFVGALKILNKNPIESTELGDMAMRLLHRRNYLINEIADAN